MRKPIRPEISAPMVAARSHGGIIFLRFAGILFVVIVLLALAWHR